MIKKISITILLLIALNGFAQKSNSSPYSFFGIGENVETLSVEQIGMGGAGVSFQDNYHLNFSNPASLASLQYTVYTVAGTINNLTVKDNVESEKASNTKLSYLTVGVPISKNSGLFFGLKPKSSVGYSLLKNTLDNEDEIIDATLLEGSGGVNSVFLGVGKKIAKGFNIGLKGEYTFGNIENAVTNQLADISLATKYKTKSTANGFNLHLGAQYQKQFKNELNLNLGIALEFENELDVDGNEYIYTLNTATGVSKDTISSSNIKGIVKSPLKTTIGVGLGKANKWFASVDYSFQDALEFTGGYFDLFNNVQYENSNKLAVGGFYIPKFNSISSYWNRVVYRAGLKIEKTGLKVSSQQSLSQFTSIDDFGISFGVGLPIGNQLSNINVAFELGKRGNTDNGIVQENYFNLRLGLSLNDKWFRKRKID